MTAIFFGALILFVWWLASLTTRAMVEGEKVAEAQRKEARRKQLAILEKEFYGDEAEAKPRKKKSAVKFVEVEEEEVEEVDENKGTYVYDPVAHKVVFVPSENI